MSIDVNITKLKDVVNSCTEKPLSSFQIKKILDIKSSLDLGQVATKIEGKEHGIARSMLLVPGNCYLLMTHTENDEDIELGEGFSKKAKYAIDMTSFDRRVVSICRKDRCPPEAWDSIPGEIDMMRRCLAVEGVVHLEWGGQIKDKHYLIMEDCLKGDLLDALNCRMFKTATQITNLVSDLAGGLKELHGLGIAHRDIKPDNIFLTVDRAKLGDLGSACHIDNPQKCALIEGTVSYFSPEKALHWLSKTSMSLSMMEKADIWAMGLIFYRLFTGHDPYFLTHPDRHTLSQLAVDIMVDSFSELKKRCKCLLKGMLQVDYTLRFNAVKVQELLLQMKKRDGSDLERDAKRRLIASEDSAAQFEFQRAQ